MTCPSCGDEKIAVIMDSNLLSVTAYLTFKESDTELCFRCWVDSNGDTEK